MAGVCLRPPPKGDTLSAPRPVVGSEGFFESDSPGALDARFMEPLSMVRIRMKRMGRTHRPFFRINAVDQRSPRDGRVIEQLGWYDPKAKDPAKQLHLEDERVKHWLKNGAQPSDTINDILAKRGLIDADAWKKKREARVKRKLLMLEKARAAAPAEGAKEAKKEG